MERRKGYCGKKDRSSHVLQLKFYLTLLNETRKNVDDVAIKLVFGEVETQE